MRLLIRFGLIALVGLWLVGEFAAAPVAERLIEQEVKARYRDAATVEVDIASFPLVSRVALTEKIRKLTVTLDQIARQSITYGEVRFELMGIVVDRSAILRADPRVKRIDRGIVTATIDVAALEGIPSLASTDVRVDGRLLNFGGASVPIDKELVPCDPEARVEGDSIILSCEIDEVPATLLKAAQNG
jgi:hypothetical protein